MSSQRKAAPRKEPRAPLALILAAIAAVPVALGIAVALGWPK